MKKIILFLFASFIFLNINAQLLKLASKDSLNGKPTKQFYTTAWVKLLGFYDQNGIPNVSSMSLPSIPTERDSIIPDAQFHADLYQTRLIFASAFQTKSLGEIKSYIETDFYGNGGGGLRLRHAWVRFNNWRIGQAWSGFTDEESWANVIDFDGPATGVWVRTAQITHWFRPNKNNDILVALETPITDYSRYLQIDSLIKPTNQSLPDFVTHYEYRWKTGHFQLSAVARAIEYQNAQNKITYQPAGGINISGSQHFFGKDLLVYQATYGQGISRYLVSFGGGGWDAVPDLNGNLELVPIHGGYIGYQYFYGKKKWDTRETNHFSSTFVYGYVQLDNPLEIPQPTLLTGHYASANLYWHIVKPLNLAVEGIYGFRTDEFESSGKNLRIQFTMEYNF